MIAPAPLALYVVETQSLPDTEIDAFAAPLDATERTRAARLPERERRDFLVAHGLARHALSRLCPDRAPAAWRFRQGPQGKPAPVDAGDMEFSLTHTRGLVAVAVSRCGPVGVDAEAIRPDYARAETAALLCHARELAEWHALEPSARTEAFFALWTLKESLLKAAGDGLTFDPRAIRCALEPVRMLAHHLPAQGRWMSWSARLASGFQLALSLDANASPEPLTALMLRSAAGIGWADDAGPDASPLALQPI